jgi:hypothetical protein
LRDLAKMVKEDPKDDTSVVDPFSMHDAENKGWHLPEGTPEN